MEKLEGKVAIVTGGAMGNGLGIVKVFLKYGAKVAILDYSDKLDETVNKLKEEGKEVLAHKVDIRDFEGVKNAVDDIALKYGKIDILVNNAGVCRLEKFMDMDDKLRDFHFDINIKGTWNVSKACVPYMQKNLSGSIVNLSSVTGPMVADSGEVAYATTKSALEKNGIQPKGKFIQDVYTFDLPTVDELYIKYLDALMVDNDKRGLTKLIIEVRPCFDKDDLILI